MVTNVGERCVSMVNHAPRLKGRAPSIPIFCDLTHDAPPPATEGGGTTVLSIFGNSYTSAYVHAVCHKEINFYVVTKLDER